MDLNPRKLRILRAIVDEYILSGAPVGSKVLSQNPSFKLSSATIRNEMSHLEDLGYLEQPHTSAGRVPSDKAYRLYVNNMMQRSNLTEDEVKVMSSYCQNKVKGLDAVMRETASVLSNITHYTALVMMPESRGADELDRISRIISQRYYNCRMTEVGEKMTKELGMELLDRGTFLTDLVDTMETAPGANAHRIALSGTNNMLDYPAYSDIDRARQLLATVEKKDSMYRLLKNAGPFEISVKIGSELGQDIFSDCSLVTATYRIGSMPVGTMGVIGPTRMPYGKVVSVLDYMSKSLGSILTNLLEED